MEHKQMYFVFFKQDSILGLFTLCTSTSLFWNNWKSRIDDDPIFWSSISI